MSLSRRGGEKKGEETSTKRKKNRLGTYIAYCLVRPHQRKGKKVHPTKGRGDQSGYRGLFTLGFLGRGKNRPEVGKKEAIQKLQETPKKKGRRAKRGGNPMGSR